MFYQNALSWRRSLEKMVVAAGVPRAAPLLRHAACLLACARHLGPRAAVQGGSQAGGGDLAQSLAQSPELLGRALSPVVSEQARSKRDLSGILARYHASPVQRAWPRTWLLATHLALGHTHPAPSTSSPLTSRHLSCCHHLRAGPGLDPAPVRVRRRLPLTGPALQSRA